jgi:hypothetical protein
MAQKEPFTVGDLRRHLKLCPDDYELRFGPSDTLTFYRTKMRADTLVQIEFNALFEITDRGAGTEMSNPVRMFSSLWP